MDFDKPRDVYTFKVGDHEVVEYAEDWDYEPPISDEMEDWEREEALEDAREFFRLTPAEFVEQTVMVPHPETREMTYFSYEERPYLRRVYNTPIKRTILMCGRQVEKTVREDEPVLLADGRHIPIKDIQLGDLLACLKTGEQDFSDLYDGSEMVTAQVTWKSRRYKKPCLRIRTRQGHVSEVATTHPMRTWDDWTEAGALEIGARIAVVRKAGEFFAEPIPESRVGLTAFMLGDGGCNESVDFTNGNFEVLEEFVRLLESEGMDYSANRPRNNCTKLSLPLYKANKLWEWLEEDGLRGTDSYTKFVPDWVFRLSRAQTATFLNRLWSTDGHVKCNTDTKWSIEYCSMSRKLVFQVQALLWKFGIPSKIRENWPAIYKRRGEKKLAYILRVETQEGVRAFVRDIGALGKIERTELEPWEENNNRDTFPLEVNELVAEIYEEVAPTKGDRTLRSEGIERLPRAQYCLTKEKLRRFVEFFEGDIRYDEKKVDLLRNHLDSDIYWDEIEEIEVLGEQWCYDLTVAEHHNFIAGAMITHNSTSLGNRAFAYSCLIPHFKTLYVSPSSTQTKEFSKTRLKEVMETSPAIKAWFPDRLTDNVYEKRAINRSQLTLRYAFLNADRCRGLSADFIMIDEFQDIILDNIPVIEEAASHSPFKFYSYSGTPKSLDNPMQYYWDRYSTQNEWSVPCDAHGTPKNPGSWHWNILGEKNIGTKSLICDRCGKPINPLHPHAQWVQLGAPDPRFELFEGFRIPQLMVPWIEWSNILTKYNGYSRAKFYNEVLGQSFDSGQRPLTRQDVIDNCDPEMSLNSEYIKKLQERLLGTMVYAGIDWGQDSTNSFTVLTLGAWLDGYFRIFFCHQFKGVESEPKVQIEKIKRLLNAFRVVKVGVDYGGGFWPNDELLREFGSRRVFRYQYSTPRVFVKWDENLGRFLVHRSEVMSAVFNAIKRRNVLRFPRYKDFATPFAADMLAIFSEYNEKNRMTEYKKSPNTTDDTFHSTLFCLLVAMLDTPRPDILVPSAYVDQMLMED